MLASLSDSLFRGKKMNTLLGTIITALVTDENDKLVGVLHIHDLIEAGIK